MPTYKFTKKIILHVSFHVFRLHFLRTLHDHLFRRGFESVRAKFCPENINKLLVINSFNHYLSQLPSGRVWTLVFVK